ncbi:helix-turn-helix transcriptional regulator [Collinsella sp. OM06-18AC]|uniref:helix-turn-helix transcriptional regulator n=1 Tax=Collinsella sp. OM06-18AC TaxID=2292327 RepID=UPI0013145B2F|nr:helix-turn-helix transcriptional regulator [Collinsella sp. OM06-18AC]
MRDLGDTTAYLRRGMREILCLALFFFTFLACEYFFDARMAEFVPSSEVVIYESIVVGASVIGFFVRPFLYYRRPQTIDATSDITGVLLVSALLLMIMAVRFEVVIAGGLAACCALGYCGSTAHANLARRFAQTPCLARAVAVSYAAGILVQVLNHMVMPAGIPQQSVLIACAIALVGLLHGARRAKLRDEPAPEFEVGIAELSVDALERGARWHDDPEAKATFQGAVVRLTVATACLTGVFAALNAGLTTSHAAGAIDLGDWPRLLLVVSALAAGVLYDLRGRSYMNIIMTCAAMLSTLSFFVLITDGNGGNTLAATIIFYLGSGFFVVFFTTKFAAISVYAHWSYLWPCMGRVINNVCAMFVTAPAVAIVSSQNVLLAVGAGLVLFVGIAISLLGQFGHRTDDIAALNELAFAADDLDDGSVSTQSEPAPAEASELTLDERLDAFAAAFELTQRERDILEALVASHESVQDIAATLFLSRSTLYRHIASINKKTGASSRLALINFFWSWSPKD